MVKHPHARRPGHKRTIWVTARFAPDEKKRLESLARAANAPTISEYLRVAGLKIRVRQIVHPGEIRTLIGTMVQLAEVLETVSPGPLQEQALQAAVAAFERVARS